MRSVSEEKPDGDLLNLRPRSSSDLWASRVPTTPRTKLLGGLTGRAVQDGASHQARRRCKISRPYIPRPEPNRAA